MTTKLPENIQIYLYERDYENKVCLECKTPKPEYVSINNSILLCSECSKRHKNLGYNISYIRKISEEWDPYILNYLERGGNSRFIRLSKKYNLDNYSIEEKYSFRIVEYYRLLLKSEVLCDEPPNEINNMNLYDKIDNNIIYFPEFQNYQIFKGKNLPDLNNKASLINIFRAIGIGIYNSSSYINNKIEENHIKDKVVNGGISLFKGIKNAGKYIYKTGKPFVKYISIKSFQGIGYLCNKAVDNLKDGSISQEKENIGDNFFNVTDYVFNPNQDFPTYDEIIKGNDNVINFSDNNNDLNYNQENTDNPNNNNGNNNNLLVENNNDDNNNKKENNEKQTINENNNNSNNINNEILYDKYMIDAILTQQKQTKLDNGINVYNNEQK